MITAIQAHYENYVPVVAEVIAVERMLHGIAAVLMNLPEDEYISGVMGPESPAETAEKDRKRAAGTFMIKRAFTVLATSPITIVSLACLGVYTFHE